jgi:hypothetical protein
VSKAKAAPARVSLALFGFLFAICMLNYCGQPHSSDGLAMLATAESLVRHGRLDMNAYLWLGLQQGSFGPDGSLYSRKGFGQVLACLPLAWLGLHLRGVGLVQMAMLLGPLVAAATGTCLHALALQLGHSQGAALAVALIYGLATPALPYSKYFFSDPLAGLFLLLACWAWLRWHKQGSRASAALCGCAVGAAALTRSPSLVAAAVLLLAALWPLSKRSFSRRQVLAAACYIGGLLPWLVSMGLINWLRYGSPWNSGYLAEESFSGNWLEGVLGLLVSPGRGLFLYAPVLALALPGWRLLLRQEPAVALVFGALVSLHLLLYGKWFMWHGGYCWGPRFLLPTVPLLALCLAPLWQRGGSRRATLLLLACLSFVPQFLGSAVDFALYQEDLLRAGWPLFDRATLFRPALSPLLAQWRYLEPHNLDWAWARADGLPGRVDPVALGALLAACALGALAIWRAVAGGMALWAWLALVLPLTSAALCLPRYYRAQAGGLDELLAAVERNERPGDALITTIPGDSLPLTDRYKGRLRRYGAPDPLALLEELGQRHGRLWLLQGETTLEASPAEQWLAGWGYQLLRASAGGRTLALYGRPSSLQPLAQGCRFAGGLVLEGAEVALEGNALYVRLLWRAERPLQGDLKVFVHARDDTSALLAQHDGMPALWQRPTSTWHRGELVEDRHGLLLAPGQRPATLHVGLYEPSTGQRLPLETGEDALRLPLPH